MKLDRFFKYTGLEGAFDFLGEKSSVPIFAVWFG